MVRRDVVGAHYGLRDWLAQRATAVVMAAYTLILLGAIAFMPRVDFLSWRALFALPWMKMATLIFVVSMLAHAWIGVRNILMDYVKPNGLRLSLYVVTLMVLVVYAGWAAQILWSV
jgi:succinate dehydrogenase / fumarate reductase membrane anchor subunit